METNTWLLNFLCALIRTVCSAGSQTNMSSLEVTWTVKKAFIWKSEQNLITSTDSLTPIKEAVFAQEQRWGRCGKYQLQPKAYTILHLMWRVKKGFAGIIWTNALDFPSHSQALEGYPNSLPAVSQHQQIFLREKLEKGVTMFESPISKFSFKAVTCASCTVDGLIQNSWCDVARSVKMETRWLSS